jgi:selenide,water dikinase
MKLLPVTRDLVLIGGGHAHALVLKMWGMNPLPGVRLTIINPDPVVPYTGMLPGFIAGHYLHDEIMIDLVRLARHADARLIFGRATGIDRIARRVEISDLSPVAFDIASIDVGITSDLASVPGFSQFAVAAKPLGQYADRWESFVSACPRKPRIVVVGAGLGGAELALSSMHRLRQAGSDPQISLLESRSVAMQGIAKRARKALLARLSQAGIDLVTNVQVAQIRASSVVLSDGSEIASDFTLAVAGARPHGWLAHLGLSHEKGFLNINSALQTSDPSIFAAGDCAAMSSSPRPKAGVFAVRQASVLATNLGASLSGRRLKAYRPQRDYLKLIATGGKEAIADKWGQSLEGRWLWKIKDKIDRRFMDHLANLPSMAPMEVPQTRADGLSEAIGEKPLCGGCGAKVGSQDLAAALSVLPLPKRPEVVSGRGDDAAILKTESGFQVLSTDHLRAFTNDHAMLSRIAATHALGDVWAMGASPQVALAQIILPRMSARMQTETLREIMASAASVFSVAGADVVGGHTSLGAELTIGFSVTGIAETLVTKGGARPGDALILTKPIGTGTILAAEMAKARVPGLLLGEVYTLALQSMKSSSSSASAILSPHARAMTDITGFGLAGHLLEILDASNCAAEVIEASVPILTGAVALSAAGYSSSLLPANRQIAERMKFAESPRASLMFDPQTAGGLLAAVPGDLSDHLLAELIAAGTQARIIGRIVAGTPEISLR